MADDPIPAPSCRCDEGPIAGLIVLRSVDYAIVGGISMLTVIIATDVLTAGEAATGYLNAAVGIGGVTGAIVAGALVLRRSLRRPMLVGAAVMAVGCAILGLATELVVAMAAIALLSAGHLVLEVTGATLLQRVTTDAVRGRAVGLMMTVDTGAEAAGSFIVPVLVAVFGTAAVLGVSGVAMLIAIVVGVALIGPSITRQLNVHEATLGRVLGLPLFAGVSNAGVERVLEQLVEVPMAAGDVVIRQGDPADRFYVIESGTRGGIADRRGRRYPRASADGTGRSLRGARAAVRGASQRHRHGSDRRSPPRARRRCVPRPRRAHARRSAGACSTSTTRCRPRRPPDAPTQPGTTLGSPRPAVYRPPT